MEKLFFITTLMLNLDTGVVTPKYQQLIYFYDRPSCEAYVQQNWTALHNGFRIYMDYNDINGRIESILMSLPPRVQWHYNHQTRINSPEEELITVLKNPREWV